MASSLNIELHTFRSPKFESVVEEAVKFFSGTPSHPLPPPSRFVSGGVYALYYNGGFELYRPIAALNRKSLSQPIYVGKAVPPGWRTARSVERTEVSTLYSRLGQHARSITQVKGLEISSFKTRFMILEGVESDLVVPIEAALIRKFKPLWNTLVDGFGNHDPGKGRYNQARSEWDVLHAGRTWAERLTGTSPQLEKIIAKIKNFKR